MGGVLITHLHMGHYTGLLQLGLHPALKSLSLADKLSFTSKKSADSAAPSEESFYHLVLAKNAPYTTCFFKHSDDDSGCTEL